MPTREAHPWTGEGPAGHTDLHQNHPLPIVQGWEGSRDWCFHFLLSLGVASCALLAAPEEPGSSEQSSRPQQLLPARPLTRPPLTELLKGLA